jgi:hypothetical protein
VSVLAATGTNDVVTAILAIAVAAVLRGAWSIQQRVSRLEAIDEARERHLDLDRADEPPDDGTEPP